MWKIKKTIFNIIIFFSIALILIGNKSAYATEMERDEDTGQITAKVTQEDAGEAMSAFAKNFVAHYSTSTVYGDSTDAYFGKKAGAKYQMDEAGFISFVVHNSLKLGAEDIFTYFVGINTPRIMRGTDDFKVELPKQDSESDVNKINKDDKLKKEEVIATVRNGDILFENGGKRVAIYVGGDIIYCDKEGDRALKQISLYPSDTTEKNEEDPNDNSNEDEKSDEKRTVFKEYCAIARITKNAAGKLSTSNITSLFNEPDDENYGKYYGTTQGSYAGSYTHGLRWLFKKFLDFFDYLFGIIALIIRAPFIGWANIVETMINDNINYISGISGIRNPEELEIQSIQEKSNVEDDISARDAYLNSRINIEDLIYNNVPLLDADLFDVKMEKYEGDINEDSILYKIRENVAGWYISIRNVCVFGMLLALVYLGIRLAIATTGDSKAKYKEMLIGWLTSFIILFFIHYIMIFVLDLNQMMVKWLKVENLQANGGVSLYDTVRTRAYSTKLSEGVPATIFYIVLIYYLIRFLSIYIRRYFTVNILALLGPIVAVRAAVEKISTGKNKSSIMSSWLTDFCLNVLLQTIHSLVYTIFMITAYEMAMKSVTGMLIALFFINFIFKAENITTRVFNFSSAKSLKDVADPKNNYFMETFALAKGVTHYTDKTIKGGFNAIKGVGKGIETTYAYIGANVTNKEMKEFRDEQGEFQRKILDKVNNKFYDITGERNLQLGLLRMKREDPRLYEVAKEMLEKRKNQKREVMKRSISNGIKPIKAMAGLITGIPLLIEKPDKGILAMYETISTLNDISKNKKTSYGYESKKTIKDKRGRVVKNIFTGGAYGTVKDNAEQLNKDLKKVRKNEKEIDDITKAYTLESEINAEVAKLKESYNQENASHNENNSVKSSGFEEIRVRMVRDSLKSVMYGKNIQSAIKSYMYKNNISELNGSDVEGILRELNITLIDDEIARLINSDTAEIENLKGQIEILRKQSEKLKEDIKLASEEVIQDEETKKAAEEAKKQLKEITKSLKEKEENTKRSEKELELIKEVEKEIKHTGVLDSAILKDKNQIKDIVRKKLKDATEIDKVNAQEIVQEFNKKVKNDELDTYASKETVKNKFMNKDGKGLDKKKAVNSILDAVLEDGNQKISEDKTSKYGKNAQYKELFTKYRELKTLNEKHRNMYNKQIINFKEHIKIQNKDKK